MKQKRFRLSPGHGERSGKGDMWEELSKQPRNFFVKKAVLMLYHNISSANQQQCGRSSRTLFLFAAFCDRTFWPNSDIKFCQKANSRAPQAAISGRNANARSTILLLFFTCACIFTNVFMVIYKFADDEEMIKMLYWWKPSWSFEFILLLKRCSMLSCKLYICSLVAGSTKCEHDILTNFRLKQCSSVICTTTEYRWFAE